MNENVKKCMEKVAQDSELTAKLSAIQDPDEAYRLASSVQDGFTKEEFIAAMKELTAVNGDLTDADMKKFAGGEDVISAATVSATTSFILSLGAAATAI